MSGAGYHNRGISISAKISSLFCLLDSSTHDEITPKIEYWIELALTQQLMTADELVEQVSLLVWNGLRSAPSFSRFLKEFRDSPRRSAQARSFVDDTCTRLFRWFVVASAEDLGEDSNDGIVVIGGGNSFMGVASYIGHLIKCDLLSHELVRLHLIKPLITHHYLSPNGTAESVRANAICRLFYNAGDALLQGLLEPEDARVCLEILGAQLSEPGARMSGFSNANLEKLRELRATWLQQRDEEERNDVAEAGRWEREVVAEIPAENENSVASAPQDLPITTNIGIPGSPILRAIEPSSALHGGESSPDASTGDQTTAVSSPALSISTVSDLTPTELGEDIVKDSGEQIQTRHETFYLEDGNVEIVCGHTVFRVHSPVVSFSSPNLRNALSPSTLLRAPMPEGCPRVVFKDNAEDFSVLLKMIYTPGFPARNKVPEFTVFASLLRMTTKYGFSDIREALIEDLKGAYPTKWEDFEMAKVLGEDVFGSPKPHPNAVLYLFLEQSIKFALPFAAYRAGLGGPSALASEKPRMVLPRLTLASIVHNMEGMRGAMTYAAQTIGHTWDLVMCSERACALNVSISSRGRRMEALKKIPDTMVKKSEGDLLSSMFLGNLLCAGCAERLKNDHRDCRKQLVWARLPRLIGWKGWEGV